MSKKVFIIEDEQTILNMYKTKFTGEGYEVDGAMDGEEGLKKLEEFLPDVLLLDLSLPGMNGAELLKIARSKVWGKDLKVIVMTNTGANNAPDELNGLNISRYFVKANTTPEMVEKTVAELINQK
ncbi:MAG: response regulator [bacterium]|nr:response regulator [bacterium]